MQYYPDNIHDCFDEISITVLFVETNFIQMYYSSPL